MWFKVWKIGWWLQEMVKKTKVRSQKTFSIPWQQNLNLIWVKWKLLNCSAFFALIFRTIWLVCILPECDIYFHSWSELGKRSYWMPTKSHLMWLCVFWQTKIKLFTFEISSVFWFRKSVNYNYVFSVVYFSKEIYCKELWMRKICGIISWWDCRVARWEIMGDIEWR